MIVGEGRTKCFWLEPTGFARLGLRRFTFGSHSGDRGERCPAAEGDWGHDASRVIESVRFEVEWSYDEDGSKKAQKMPPDELVPAHTSSRWPRACDRCGGPFPRRPVGQWQHYAADEYIRSDTGELVIARSSGLMQREMAGALYDAEWLHGRMGQSFYEMQDRGDGIALVAICPNGASWMVDGKASSGGFWTRTGDPRNPETLTVSPSIVAGDYHGFLQQGWFTAHIG